MIKELLLPAIVGAVFGGGSVGAGVKFYMNHTYVQIEKLEKHADTIYVRQDVFQQSQVQNRIWKLQDRIQDIYDRCAREGRQPDQDEQNAIRKLQTEITRLGG